MSLTSAPGPGAKQPLTIPTASGRPTNRARPHLAYVSQKQPAVRRVLASSTKSPAQRKIFILYSFHLFLFITTMAESYQDIENRIKAALYALESSDISNILAALSQFNVLYQRLYHRFHGRLAKSNLSNSNRRLIDPEEIALCRYLDRLDHLELPAQRELLRDAVDYILVKN